MKARSFLMALFSFWILCLQVLSGAPVVTNVTTMGPFLYAGASSGGTMLYIMGSGFTGATAVEFGGTPAPYVVHSDNLITTTSPSHSPETVFVTVTTPSGTSPNSPEAYFVYQGNWQAYVSNSNIGDNTVSVINTATRNAGQINVGLTPRSIAIIPDGTKAYVTNSGASPGTVSVIDTATNTVTATVTVGVFPIGIAITPDGTQAYVTNNGSSPGSVSVINTATNTVNTITVGVNPTGIAITPDGTQAYVTNSGSSPGSVSVINTATNAVINTIIVGKNPTAIAITPNGTQAYVTNNGSVPGTVSVINTATNAVNTINVVKQPSAIAITPDGTQAYVANSSTNYVSVINTATNAVNKITVGANPSAIAVTPDDTQAYVNIGNNVAVIDTMTNTLVGTIAVGNFSTSLNITPDGAQVYIINSRSDNVSVIDTMTHTVLGTIQVGSFPAILSITPDQAPLAKFKVMISSAGSPSTFDASQSVSPVGTIINYFWDFGDGMTLNTSQPIVFHTYAVPGNYSVTLTVTNSAGTSTKQFLDPFSFFGFNSSLAFGSTTIIRNGGPSAISMQTITVPSNAPIIQNISPSSSSTCGGTNVTITGVNLTGTTAVFFGAIPATQFTVQSDTMLTVIVPPEAPGTVDITVVTPFGTSAFTAADQFTYLPPSPPKDLRGRQVKNKFTTQTDVINIITFKTPSQSCAPMAYRIYRNRELTQLIATLPAHKKLEFIEHNRKPHKIYEYFIVSVDRFGNVSSPAKTVIRGSPLTVSQNRKQI